MAKFYVQLEDKLLKISGDLTVANISKALGYVPVSPNAINELSQRVDNITFDILKDSPFLQDGSGELNIVDDAGNIIAKIDADGIHSVDFIAGEHRLSDKTDKTYVDEAIKNVKVDLTGYATEEYVNNIDFYNINNNPIVNGEENSLTIVDENGNIGLKVTENGLYIKDVIADGHTLSQKADKSELPTKTSDLTNDSGFITVSDIPEVEIPSVDGFVKSEDLPNFDEFAKTIDIPSLDGYATEEWVANQNYLTEHQDISHLATKDEVSNIEFYNIKDNPIVNNGDGKLLFIDENGYIGLQLEEDGLYVKDVFADGHKLSEKVDKTYVDNSIAELVDGAPETLDTLNELAAALNDNADIVDVLNQSIGSKQDTITDLETIRHGAAKGATALQSYTEQYKGTVTGVMINGETKNPLSGVVDLGTVITEHQDISGKQDTLVSGTNIITINNNSILGSGNLDLATSDQLRSFQPTLVSGTNIKTVNSTSLLGSGNIAIKDTKNLTYSLNNSTSGTVTLLPNVCIYMPNVLTGKLAINACATISSNNADLIESRICFRMPNNAILPAIQFNGVAIRWAGGNAPTFEADFTYEVSLFYPSNANSVGPMGVCVGFK